MVRADPVAQCAIACRATVSLDPGMLVGRDRLARDLPAEPVGRLGHRWASAGGRGERRGNAAQAAAGHQDVASPLRHRPSIVPGRVPKVSVIVPVFNPGERIDPLLDSLLGQSLPVGEHELIFVDDGSTDGTGRRGPCKLTATPEGRIFVAGKVPEPLERTPRERLRFGLGRLRLRARVPRAAA